jgi:hypothetical protein
MALFKIKSQNIEDGAITQELFDVTVSESIQSLKISNVSIANSTYHILDDTAVNVGGGYLVVTGSGFNANSVVMVGSTPALATSYINSTTLHAEVDAASARTYDVYVTNDDGDFALKKNGVTYSGSPTWVTGSTLTSIVTDIPFTGIFEATGATSYANTTALPSGFNLVSANGYYYGTVSVGSTTNYNFTIRATDDENQDSDKTFSLSALVTNSPTTVEYLVVAGGAGGGAWRDSITNGGGGGAGGLRTGNLSITFDETYTITVGSGGAGGISGGYMGANGSISSLSTIESAGGGAGGSYWLAGTSTQYYNGFPGGSGGGGGGLVPGITTLTYGGLGNVPSVTPSQGNAGGNGAEAASPQAAVGGGGGGSGQAANISIGGNGSEWPTGSGTYYAGGGNGFGGPGGGTAPLGGAAQQSTAPANSGGGGGGGNGGGGGAGGSGVVIIRYNSTKNDASATTGSPTYTNSGGYKTYKFTGSGSITFTA